MICENCGAEFFSITFGTGRFCCKRCARQFASKQNRKEVNNKISESLKKYCQDHCKEIKDRYLRLREEYNKNPHKCKVCGKILPFEMKNRKTCGSRECKYSECGGVRKNSGTGKCGYYKGIFCSSTYELAFLIYCMDNNIKIERCTRYFEYTDNGEIHKYYPDFEIENNGEKEIIEIKGYCSDSVLLKMDSVEKLNINYKILFKKDLKRCFDHVRDNYSTDLPSLYDNSKYKYSYRCSYCGKQFEATRRRKTENVYCCRLCSIKGNGKRRVQISSGVPDAGY